MINEHNDSARTTDMATTKIATVATMKTERDIHTRAAAVLLKTGL